jgi:hypothetical protein
VFGSDEQLARACRALCALVGLGSLWTIDRPSPRAMALLEADGGPLSSGERIVVLTAWNIWNGSGNTSLGDAIHRLDDRSLAALGSLLVAVAGGAGEIDRWLALTESRLGIEGANAPEGRR